MVHQEKVLFTITPTVDLFFTSGQINNPTIQEIWLVNLDHVATDKKKNE